MASTVQYSSVNTVASTVGWIITSYDKDWKDVIGDIDTFDTAIIDTPDSAIIETLEGESPELKKTIF